MRESMKHDSEDIEFDYVRDVGTLRPDLLAHFYEILAHNLTVCVRGIWSDEQLNDAQRVEQMKWMNEIMHRIVMKSSLLRIGRNNRTELETWEMIQSYIEKCPPLAPHIAFATRFSYQTVINFHGPRETVTK